MAAWPYLTVYSQESNIHITKKIMIYHANDNIVLEYANYL